ncbi:glycoside hydrolase family 32 protein [Nostoc sp. PA-18-2419]|uniref:glucosamine inositolphosphorylceramide transferase family protein n=1 Tax=Nostoc sp. PA-18-2419 TaxID=2575443 RepID=UPI001109C9C4|nr:glycoside hydrolase family 32 protein [Nostoc sp. PA-18-2419]
MSKNSNPILQVFDKVSQVNSRYLSRIKNIAKIFVTRRSEWSIGIYLGESPFSFVSANTIINPVLTAKDITDVPAHFVADPFMVREDGIWYMFFEVLNSLQNKGVIGLANSNDAYKWNYQQIVLDEPFHLSYPYVFKFQNDYYMIPETSQASSIRLYKATNFPTKWSFIQTLLSEKDFVDPSIFQYNNLWWLLTATSQARNTLRLYYSQNLMDTWIEHPQSPVIKGSKNIARPAGRVIVFDGKIIRYTQDCERVYGHQVRAFQITELTTTNYQEKEIKNNPVIKASGLGWNQIGMHHIDAHQIDKDKWIACVDGKRYQLVFNQTLITKSLANINSI